MFVYSKPKGLSRVFIIYLILFPALTLNQAMNKQIKSALT